MLCKFLGLQIPHLDNYNWRWLCYTVRLWPGIYTIPYAKHLINFRMSFHILRAFTSRTSDHLLSLMIISSFCMKIIVRTELVWGGDLLRQDCSALYSSGPFKTRITIQKETMRGDACMKETGRSPGKTWRANSKASLWHQAKERGRDSWRETPWTTMQS